jgi:hypothetical protein
MFAQAYMGRKRWAKPNNRFLKPVPTTTPRVPHISLVFREMWDTTTVSLRPFRTSGQQTVFL